MIDELPINLIEDFPVVSKLYKENFVISDNHLLAGARIIPKNYITELSESIRQQGLYHPILVRKQYHSYQIISGHVRKYAFKKLGNETIPATVIEVDDLQAKIMLITTNRFQHSLEQIEEGWVVQDLIGNHNKSLRECASILNVSRMWVYHRYLLATKLIKEIQLDIIIGLVSPRVATEIAAVHARGQLELSKTIKQHKLSFRESYELIKLIKNKDISDKVKELALNDPRTVIEKTSSGEIVYYSSRMKLSYFANNFQKETNRTSAVLLELIHRIRRDFTGFSELERQILVKDLVTVDKRINELSKSLKQIEQWEGI